MIKNINYWFAPVALSLLLTAGAIYGFSFFTAKAQVVEKAAPAAVELGQQIKNAGYIPASER